MSKTNIFGDLVSKAEAVAVRNVLNPLLWLNVTVVPIGLAVVVMLQEKPWLAVPIMLTALGVPIWTLKHYGHFARTAPQRLQSEEFVLQQQRMMIQQKGSAIEIDITTLELGSNPEIAALPDLSDSQKMTSEAQSLPTEPAIAKVQRDV